MHHMAGGPYRVRSRAEQSALELQRPAQSDAERDARALGRKHDGDSRAALAEIATALGHTGGRVVPTVSGARWFGMCGCGVVTGTRTSEREALGSLMHHVKGAIRDWHRTGLPLAAARKAPPPDWEAVARRTPHYAAWRVAVAEEVPSDEIDRVNVGESPDSVRRAV